MIKKERYHFEPNQVKLDILDFILKNNEPVREPEIREHLKKKYGGINQSNVNRPLHWLYEKNCIELEKSRSNIWSVKTLKNLENIIKEFPDFIEILQNDELALKLVVDAMINALVHYKNQEHRKILEIEQYLEPIRKDLRTKLTLSTSFFKLCVTDEYALYRNLSDLSEISDGGPRGHVFVIDDVPSVFVNSTACADVAFKACVAFEIMERKGNSRKHMKEEMDYIKEINNVVSKEQLNELKKYYDKLRNEAKLIKELGRTDPDKQLEYLKNNYEKFLKAPYFLKANKWVKVTNSQLYELEMNFSKDDENVWDYLDCKEQGGPA